MSHSPTVTLRFGQAVLRAAEHAGVGLPTETVAQLDNFGAVGRAPLSALDAVWEAIGRTSDDPLIGLRLGLEIEVGHLDSAGLMLMSCETLGDAVDTLVEYFPIIAEGSHFDTTPASDGLRLRYLPGYTTARELRTEAALGCVVRLARWITGERFQPQEVRLRHRPRDAASRYASMLGLPAYFDCADYSVLLQRSALSTPLIQANPAVREHLRQVADDMLAGLSEQSTSAQVEALVRRQPQWTRERVAQELFMSGRHLNRRLADEGSSFKVLRDATRYQLAEQQLRGRHPISAIAESLGFADESAFAKAFRRWAGESPARYRDRLLGQ